MFAIGDHVKMRYAGLLGTIEAVISPWRVIVRWNSGLTTTAQTHELENLSTR
jgi:hypothetical protein